MSSTPRCLTRTCQRPSTARVMPVASVPTSTAAPAAAACAASWASNRVRSSTQPTSRSATLTSVSSGARKITRVILRAAQSAPSGLANSRNPASPTPSAQRTGDPTAQSRSNRATSSSGAACFACQAATAPAGPAPTTRTSRSGIGYHGERPDGAGGDTLLAAGAAVPVHRQDVELQVDRLWGAEGEAQPAPIADGQVHDGDFSGRDATHGGTVAAG